MPLIFDPLKFLLGFLGLPLFFFGGGPRHTVKFGSLLIVTPLVYNYNSLINLFDDADLFEAGRWKSKAHLGRFPSG